MSFDLLIKGARLVDPAQGIDAVSDIAFADGKVAKIAPAIAESEASNVRRAEGHLVLPGLIDFHTHVYWGGTSLGVDAEETAVASGTTTFVDAGSAGAGNMAGFVKHVMERSAPRILAFINVSFPGIFGFSREVMVGENSDLRLLSARECLRVAREFPDVVLVRNTDNVGFAKASNQAAALATGRYLFFLNNDTLVPAGTLRQLLDYADRHPEAGMIGPRLRGGDGQTQISYRQKPTMGALLHKTSLLRWTGWFRQAYIDYRRASFDGDHVGPVEVLMGAAVFMRREVYDSIGGWDEDYLFGGEDIDLSTRVGRVHSLVFLGDVPIVHYGRISSRQNIGFAAPNVTIGYVHYFRKNGASRSAMLAYKLVVSLDAPVQYILKGLEYYARRWLGDATKAEKSRIALAGIGQFLRSELLRFWKA